MASCPWCGKLWDIFSLGPHSGYQLFICFCLNQRGNNVRSQKKNARMWLHICMSIVLAEPPHLSGVTIIKFVEDHACGSGCNGSPASGLGDFGRCAPWVRLST